MTRLADAPHIDPSAVLPNLGRMNLIVMGVHRVQAEIAQIVPMRARLQM